MENVVVIIVSHLPALLLLVGFVTGKPPKKQNVSVTTSIPKMIVKMIEQGILKNYISLATTVRDLINAKDKHKN